MATKKSNTSRRKKNPARKKKKVNRKNTSLKRRLLKIFGSTALVLFLLGVLFFILVFLGVLGPVPSKQQLHVINNPIASEVFSVDGKVLGRYYIENRSYATFDEISPNVINALIATEDARFYEHRGIDEIALMRVLVKSILLQNSSAGGGSTLSQQIAKNLFPRVAYGPISLPVNKLREAIIAYRLERIYSKEEILALYLNTVPFAENIYGIEVAAERFYSKLPAKLDVNEAAVLVGMLKANNYYNPRTHPERAKGRRDVVIEQMEKYGYLSAEDAEIQKAKPLAVDYNLISYNQGPAPYFLEKLRPELLQWCANHTNEKGENYNLFTDGLKIKTTLDYNLQRYAQQSVKEYMKTLQQVFDEHWKDRDIFKGKPEVIQSAVNHLKNQTGNTEIDLNEKIDVQLFTWDSIVDRNVTRLDSIKHYLKMLNAGFIAIDPKTSELKAWVGGIDFRFFQFDHVTAPRQTGSTFKPFVYLAALESDVPPDKYFTNEVKVYDDFQGWSPKNSHDDYGGYYTMKGALAKSLNTVSVDVMLEAGITNTIEVAKNLGISGDMPAMPSLALGVASVSLKEMVEAFAGIVNDGKPVQSHYLLEISDRNGNVLETFQYKLNTQPVVSSENCRAVINMMEAVVNEGTGSRIRTTYKVPGDFAGKTGTTQNNSDGWFIGLTPNLVTGCWVGADDPRIHFRTTSLGQGAYMALPIVGKFFNKTYSDPKFSKLKNSHFAQPDAQLLAILDMPSYREVLEIEDRAFNLADLFRRKDRSPDLKEMDKDQVQTDMKKTEEKNTVPIWEKIRKIFKKKK